MENTKTTDNSKIKLLFFSFAFHTVCIQALCGPCGLSVCCLQEGFVLSAAVFFRDSTFQLDCHSLVSLYGAFAFISQNVEPFQHPDETLWSV